ncbi:bifunctional RecB family nuclease/DEAD/DEAH box helicase [Halovivax gelatinilyticus]|uniref:bifunctional RecB family nuclease/DEAD/DEAH box helicase n=1 Tax=Halovivax gelatinilyticus TaxID=2961597 RepID=UPI0020CA8324|nr:AAA domain-containing protein [Halovivax gelatinilyticus]
MVDTDDRPAVTLNPSGLGQYISYSGCPRFFRLKFFDHGLVNKRNWYDPNAGSDLFAELGLAYEEEQLKTLSEDASRVIGDTDSDGDVIPYDETWEDNTGSHGDIETQWKGGVREQLINLIETLADSDHDELDGPVVLFQTPMFGRIGVWDIAGIADLITLEPLPESRGVRTRVLEVKTSWKDKTSQQIQSTIYSLLLSTVVSECGVDHEPVATVVNREADLREHPLPELPPIDLPSRTAEVKRLLKQDGELHQLARKSFDEVGYRLERKCDGCPYNGICFTKAIESRDPALLNLTQGNQERLRVQGIDSLAGLTDLFEREEGTKPYDYDELPVRDETIVRALESEGTLSNRLDEIVQRAQVLRGELDPSYDSFGGVEYLRGSGNGNLPDDDPHPRLPGGACERNELIRVYLYVQHDPVRDRLALLAARINCDKTDATTVVEFSEQLPAAKDDSLDAEAKLLEAFFERLIKAIQGIKAEFGSSPDQGYVHLYTYSAHERDALMEGVQRQPSVFGSAAVRDLLGLREGLDQPMVSVVHNDITSRLALQYPGTGLIQTVEQMQAFADESYPRRWFSATDWKATIAGDEVDLRDVFRTGLFEGKRAYVEEGNSIRLLLGDPGDPDREPDGFYPLYNRFGNQIPLEYLWAARGKLDDDVELGTGSSSLSTYRYYDGEGSKPIGAPEVKALAQRLTEALEHVERAIAYKNWQIDKQPLDLSRLPAFSLENIELNRACQEYLDLEHTTNYRDCLDHYLKPPRKRMQTGDSTIFRVTNVEPAGQWDIRVEGDLLYDELFRNPDQVIDSCRISGSDDGGSGSWRVMSKLERNGREFRQVNATYPRYLANSIKASVESFDRTGKTITVSASTHGGFGRSRYLEWHRSATMEPEEADGEDYTTLVSEGDLFVLDPYADSYPALRAYEALERTESNALYHQLNRAFQDGETEQFDRQFCSPTAVADFIETFEDATGARPRGNQAEFVKEVDHSVSVLQGPPGTGKTSFTLAPAVLARLAASEDEGDRLLTVVTAPSHTAVDEAMEDIVTNWADLTESSATTAATEFVRVRAGSSTDVREAVDEHVRFVDYYDTTDVVEMTDALRPHVTPDGRATNHLVVFTTPTSLRGVINKCSGELFALDDAEAVMDAGISFVDLLAIDEASMLDLPATLLSSAFLKDDAQTLLIGDHRQMEPVQQHDWEGEDRRTIEENVPFMSVLNFVRFLRGDLEETDFAFAQSPDIGDAIPITRLDRTYRLHTRVADLLTDLVYTDDGIKLKSSQTATIDHVHAGTDGVAAAMNPQAPAALVIHDEDESQDANRTEVAIVAALLSALDDPQPTETGIVTPHNAQKGRLNQQFNGTATIDTVERFQGGERDVMVISATASDPDYVRSEAEFLLNPNRLNVAMSRMKKKLVIVASESVFEVTPPNADEFDQTLIWKRLYDALGVTDNSPATSVWEGDLGEFCPSNVDIPRGKSGTNIDVYALESE